MSHEPTTSSQFEITFKQQIATVSNQQNATVSAGETILEAANRLDIDIPVLCHYGNQLPVGVCRVCVVELEQQIKNRHGEYEDKYKDKPYTAACVRKLDPREDKGLVVHTRTDDVVEVRRGILELLMADHEDSCHKNCRLEALAQEYKAINPPHSHRKFIGEPDDSSPVISVNHEACILCDRCVRACEMATHFVIGRCGKGHDTKITFDLGKPMGFSTCVSCGACMFACPTGALTAKAEAPGIEALKGYPGCGTEELSVQELLELEVAGVKLFNYVPESFLTFNRRSMARVTVPPHHTLFVEGDPGETAFCILNGEIELSIMSDLAHVETKPQFGPIGNMESILKERRNKPGYIAIDAPVRLAYDNPAAILGEGHLFGEMSCMNAYPRSVTVRTLGQECVLLEMRRNVLEMLRNNKDLRKKMDEDYRTEALHVDLRAFLPSLKDQAVAYLRPRVQLQSFIPKQVIYHEGDIAEAFYIVRTGFVKVSVYDPEGEIVLAYLPKGWHFGERSLLRNSKHLATCTAEDNVDVVRIAAADFREMLRQCPELEDELNEHVARHDRENMARKAEAHRHPADDLTAFGEQGLEKAQDLLVLDLKRCTRCDQCVTACADAHDGVTRLIRDGRRFGNYLVATACRHCQDPLCMVGCPVSAIHRETSLEVKIEDWCIGCKRCADNCPYGNINIQEFPQKHASTGQQSSSRKATVSKATNCNLCKGQDEPSCVYACPHDAAHRVSPQDFQELLKK